MLLEKLPQALAAEWNSSDTEPLHEVTYRMAEVLYRLRRFRKLDRACGKARDLGPI
jgi:hypothetical protein